MIEETGHPFQPNFFFFAITNAILGGTNAPGLAPLNPLPSRPSFNSGGTSASVLSFMKIQVMPKLAPKKLLSQANQIFGLNGKVIEESGLPFLGYRMQL